MSSFDDHSTSYKSPKLVGNPGNAQGDGLFATETIEKGELLVTWGGQIVSRDGFDALPASIQSISLQIDDDLFIAPTRPSAADRVNHSCNPNAGMSGPIALVAMRRIRAGEEICYDYAMSDGSDYDEFECRCGAASCRGRVTGNDWRNRDLWKRYKNHFSPYLERRIRKLSRGERATAVSSEISPDALM